MEYLAEAEPQRVLDIGCGTGIYSAKLASRGIAVTGLDSCKEMIDATESLLAQSGLSDRVQTVLADYLDWSGETGQEYDLALAIGVLDYVNVNDAGVIFGFIPACRARGYCDISRQIHVFFHGRY